MLDDFFTRALLAGVGLALDYLLMGSMLAGFITFIFGLLLLTTQEPRDALTESDMSARIIVRGCSVAMPILYVIDNVLPPPWSVIVLSAFFAAMLVGLVGGLRRLEALAQRIPHPDLVKLARRSHRRIAACGCGTAVAMIVDELTPVPQWLQGLLWLVFMVSAFRGLALFARLRSGLTAILERPAEHPQH